MYASDANEYDENIPAITAPCIMCQHLKISKNSRNTPYCKYRTMRSGGLELDEMYNWGKEYITSCDAMKYNDKRVRLI